MLVNMDYLFIHQLTLNCKNGSMLKDPLLFAMVATSRVDNFPRAVCRHGSFFPLNTKHVRMS